MTEELIKEVKEENKKADFKNMQLIVFKVGTEEYGLTIDQIKEVVITPAITKVPLTASYIKGVANVRGNVLALIDLEQRFGFNTSEGESEKPKYTLVVESEDFKMGILVKEVPNTLSVSQSDIDQSPNVIHDGNLDKNYIKGIVKLGSRLIILVDIYKIILKEEVSSAIIK